MPAIAGNFDNVLIFGVFAMIAAIFVISAYRAATAIVTTSVIVICH
jgi:hypothetical protein